MKNLGFVDLMMGVVIVVVIYDNVIKVSVMLGGVGVMMFVMVKNVVNGVDGLDVVNVS